MSRITTLLCAAAVATGLAVAPISNALASGHCVTKAAEATSGTEASAKWFALETMVQSVSWSLWPAFLQNGSVPGYKITSQKYRCTKSAGGVSCRGQATFCKVGKTRPKPAH